MPYLEQHFLIRLKGADGRLIVASLEKAFHGETPEMKRAIAKLVMRIRRGLIRYCSEEQVTL